MPLTKYCLPRLCAALVFLSLSCTRNGNPLREAIAGDPVYVSLDSLLRDESALTDPQERWQAYGIHNYKMIVTYCVLPSPAWQVEVTVENDSKVTRVMNVEDSSILPRDSLTVPLTIRDAFAWVKPPYCDTIYTDGRVPAPDSGIVRLPYVPDSLYYEIHSYSVTYNQKYGYPESMGGGVSGPLIMDGSWGYSISDVRLLGVRVQ